MKTLIKTFLLVGSLGVAGLMTSCQSSSSAPTGAVACPKCKTVWVTSGASGGRGNPIALKATGAMDCPDCQNTATAMLKGLTTTSHTCKSCGTTLVHCR
ncbi:MAG: hypothetical protein U0984_14325 [Prosthecobacter sp.]|nr:hypothetical protein [Prosthecobacter sp.]